MWSFIKNEIHYSYFFENDKKKKKCKQFCHVILLRIVFCNHACRLLDVWLSTFPSVLWGVFLAWKLEGPVFGHDLRQHAVV